MSDISHALVLNLHQPPGNLQHLWDHARWEAKEILFALDRIPRFLWGYESLARVHLAPSGTLLEALSNPEFQSRVYGTVDCGKILWHFQNQQIIQILGTAYYHPVLPLIPHADREEQIARWRGIGRHLFWRDQFDGFWLPEMGFTMELIPLLKQYGYRYVIVDSDHIEPVSPMSWEEIRYRPHIARHGGHEIVVIVRDRDLSNAQESGMEYSWFRKEVFERTKFCNFPPLVTTCTDGDNGGWFRHVQNECNFWGAFYRELLERTDERDPRAIRPSFISDYLNQHGAHGEVRVHTAAWNTGWHDGWGFTQWTGSWAQRAALERAGAVSQQVHNTRWTAGEKQHADPQLWGELETAMWHLLRAETSCNFFWGEAWVGRCHQDLDRAEASLQDARNRLAG